ncbi:aldehyde dehydrogenase [Fodinibius sediminis]|uniref:Aldehyde dehydrogenase n=1 Tax=Fodinibius sediminis TaxID=1214077 RepID=A0A521AIW4_9BACT|nr:aldehyde dehydrogenase [Fodinibius sediminis]SMO34752.1 aldehyde dehydrogenase (NAD+) [Fodinibius sediminis]
MTKIAERQHLFFKEGKSRDPGFRIDQLRKLKALLQQYEKEFIEALRADFAKPSFETYGTELLILYSEIDYFTTHLKDWSRPRKVSESLLTFPSKSYVYPQPYGVTLVIGAWNYPLQLSMSPVLGSLSAGNCAILKPSEVSTNTASLLADVINPNFDPGYLHVVQGGADTTQELLAESLDYIFYTGGLRVGKIIMQAAAEQLTPLTLELGGKSPAIIDRTADLELAARRISWGKFINAGQTCVSPDYTYIHESQAPEFCELMKKQIDLFYGPDPAESPDFARIINRKHFNRLKGLLDPDKIVTGGRTRAEDHYIAPTVMTDISWQDPVMQEEIFGPILPVLTYRQVDRALRAIRDHPKPLSLYLFSTDRKMQDRIIEEIPFGGGCINDTVAHLGNLDLPFGGIGNSGFGSYHGKSSFELFSHQKSVMKRSTWLDIPMRYPPYGDKLKWLKKITSYL